MTDMNHLHSEKSPYLKQHASNPVHWYPWGLEAFQKAKELNRPIFLSVGYSTCHWCHVMEEQSFTDTDVANALNRCFISIKVDREERPDVDATYMEAVQAMTGSGGWPMTVFMTPQGEPFFGGTYFPKLRFLQMIARVEELWAEDPSLFLNEGKRLSDWLHGRIAEPVPGPIPQTIFKQFKENFLQNFDSVNGGRIGHPKFPPSYALRLLLRLNPNDPTLNACIATTLKHMAQGGIYDQLGGGFHRYATDEQWLIPHFEKMLYDQAALLNLYTEAFQVTGQTEYALIAHDIAHYVLRDLTSPDGGFYSAEDADSEGKEGTFYVWTDQEIGQYLTSEELKEFKELFAISPQGNFEHGLNILALDTQQPLARAQRTHTQQMTLGKLLSIRSQRIRPLRDEKVITSWNGLMIAALGKAGLALNEPIYVSSAARAAEFVFKNLTTEEGHLQRRWIDGEAKFEAYLEDYAFFIDGLLELYNATSDALWLQKAEHLQTQQDQLFAHPEKGAYWSTAKGNLAHPHTLPHRKIEFEDSVIPSGNSISLLNLVRLGIYSCDVNCAQQVETILKNAPKMITTYANAFPQLLMSIDLLNKNPMHLCAPQKGEKMTLKVF